MSDDWRAERCGHNYSITACTAKRCDARDSVAQLARAEKVIEAARKYIDNEKHYDEFVLAVVEYDRPSAPERDGREKTMSKRCVPPDAEREGYHWVRRFRGSVMIPLWKPNKIV